ncbi:hypothetical protein PTKIN_Ptkin06aG0206100 [Pterospermum kingtungense]
MHQDLPIAAELANLRAEFRKLEGIHSDIKCSLGKVQEENTKLQQEKKEIQELVHLLQTENHQLQSSKNYLEKLYQLKAQKENRIETIGPSDSGFKNGKQIVCGFMDCMEEENSQPDDTSSTIVEGTKNSMDLSPNDEVVNKSDQEVDSVLSESKVECGLNVAVITQHLNSLAQEFVWIRLELGKDKKG